ncbi:hypothetical protein Q0M30_19175, partial [Staphylococcus aureus]|nr:hypothetical protein [Staphylococcus aureus]
MGSCAAYLPDIKTYKQFYLKLLSAKVYPLHLNERYVGLGELEAEMERVLRLYVLSMSYGLIIEWGHKYL